MSRFTPFVGVVALLLGVTACSSGDDTTTNSGAAVTNTSAATTSVQSTAPDTTTPAMPMQTPLHAGTVYGVGRAPIGRPLQFTNQVEGVYGRPGPGQLTLSTDRAGNDVVVSVTDLAAARAFIDPLTDISHLSSVPNDLTTPVNADFFAYFRALPAVTLGQVTDTTIAGHPASTATYTVGDIDGGAPCFGVDRGNCLVTLAVPAAQWISTFWSGDTGTLTVVDIDGQQVLVQHTNAPGAAETAASLVLR
jgi:hypothetical protein